MDIALYSPKLIFYESIGYENNIGPYKHRLINWHHPWELLEELFDSYLSQDAADCHQDDYSIGFTYASLNGRNSCIHDI